MPVPRDVKRVVVITGANRGLGLHVARQAAASGVPVVLLCRDREKGEAALASLDRVEGGHELVVVDLGDWEEVRAASRTIRAGRPIRALVNNAAVLPPERRLSVTGVELQLAVNHLGHFLLTRLLLPKLVEGAPSRIIGVSSGSHRGPPVRLDDPEYSVRPYHRLRAYQQSKLAGVTFILALARRLGGSGVEAGAVEPGVYATGLWEHWTGLGPVARIVVPSPARGAKHILRLALPDREDGASVNGCYYRKDRKTRPAAVATYVEDQERLWAWSEGMVGLEVGLPWLRSGEGEPTR